MGMLAVWLLAACSGVEAECSEDVSCEFGSVCVEGVCEAQGCATSSQCGIEQFCLDNACVDGCEADTDCRFGDGCDAQLHECVETACADTRLDCGFGEFCSPSGECYDAGGYYCAECQVDGDCGGGGNYCVGGYCGVTCEGDSDCPGGFDCLPFSDFNGNVIAYQCYTYCWLYGEE